MLTSEDIDFMKKSQEEIYTNRTRPITFVYLTKKYDPITGVLIEESENNREVEAVVTEMATQGQGISRDLEEGIEYDQGDIKIDVKIDLISDIVDDITQAEFDNRQFELMSVDKKGIGKRNRYEFIGREIA